MRIAAVSMDTRGGIVPYVALGLGLRRAGHEVRMMAPADFAPMLAEAGLPMAPLSGSVEEVLRGSTGATERGTVASMRIAAREMEPRIHAWTRQTLEACKGVDVVTGGVGGMVAPITMRSGIAPTRSRRGAADPGRPARLIRRFGPTLSPARRVTVGPR